MIFMNKLRVMIHFRQAPKVISLHFYCYPNEMKPESMSILDDN